MRGSIHERYFGGSKPPPYGIMRNRAAFDSPRRDRRPRLSAVLLNQTGDPPLRRKQKDSPDRFWNPSGLVLFRSMNGMGIIVSCKSQVRDSHRFPHNCTQEGSLCLQQFRSIWILPQADCRDRSLHRPRISPSLRSGACIPS